MCRYILPVLYTKGGRSHLDLVLLLSRIQSFVSFFLYFKFLFFSFPLSLRIYILYFDPIHPSSLPLPRFTLLLLTPLCAVNFLKGYQVQSVLSVDIWMYVLLPEYCLVYQCLHSERIITHPYRRSHELPIAPQFQWHYLGHHRSCIRCHNHSEFIQKTHFACSHPLTLILRIFGLLFHDDS